MSEIGIKQAAIYNAMAKYGTMIVQLGLTMILSRLILPEAFGVVAIITVILGFLNLFADLGIGINVIQHPDMPRDDIDRLFSFCGIIGVILALCTVGLAYPLAIIYEDDIYIGLCLLVSFVSFFHTLNVIPDAILRRDKQFKLIAVRSIISSLISGCIAVILAWWGWGVYALVSQSIISALFLFIWNYTLNPLKFRRFKFEKIIVLLGRYSLFQILFNFMNYFTRNLDNLIIGKYFGTANLGYYNKSYHLYLYPNTIFASVLTGVLHPYIRDYKNNYPKMYEKYLHIEKMLSVIGVFTMIVTFFCATEIIELMFGANWKPAGIYLKCLSLCMWTQMMSAVSGSIFLGLERTDQTFKCGIINLALLITSIFIGVYFKSLFLLALCVGISYNLIFLITNHILLRKTMGLSVWHYLKHIAGDGLFAFAFVGATLLLPTISENIILSFVIKLSICIIAYVLYILISGQKELFKSTIKMVRKK